MKYFNKLDGERIYLSPICVDDCEVYTKWINSGDVSIPLGNYTRTYSVEQEKQALDVLSKNQGSCNFSIILKQTDELIGSVSLFAINHIHQEASLGIFIGESSQRKNGYGREAIELILDYGFNFLNLHNIMLEVFSFNEVAMHLYESIGFKLFGKRSEAYYLDNQWFDQCYMEILKKDFTKRTIKRINNDKD